ncbi:exopolysaccharide biosynthesis polyprenyl glycosylphosphotransferase [Allocatelliglobosispora scoriae]|uniref:Exopolysaccharide biosynthesis polyprenyl glycosylphosphotransferase n=1 Tax=Allocatelliglobosispora scoriae TaxID=643052 RepID=A0A841BTV2_9ACTN|nr:exopolysaccharide biosynthesis polyprenyl glycosylphosphotransferase [Allocatelliglobosispora scoriae]
MPKSNGVARSAFTRNRRRLARWHRPYIALLVVVDIISALAGSWTAVQLFEQADSGFARFPIIYFNLIAYAMMPVGWLVLLWAGGAYDRRSLGVGTEEFKRVLRAAVTVTAGISILALGFKIDLSRWSVATAVSATLIYMLFMRTAARRALHSVRRRRHQATHRMLLTGTLQETMFVYKIVTRSPAAGLHPVAIHLSDGYGAARRTQAPIPTYTGNDLLKLANEVGADTIAVCGSSGSDPGELRRLAWQLEGSGIDLVVAPQLTDIAGPRVHIRPIEGLPLLHVEEPTLSGLSLLAKNMMDRVGAGLGLIVLTPLLAVISLAIRINDPGPVMFRQGRVGHEGRTFRVWKFRTMYTDAEDRLAALTDQNEGDGMLFKIRDDPRVTPVGRFLRATSLDELPQLINVLKGEMSLVGPRPLPADDGDFLGDVRRRLLVRPGMTGLWQVSGRSDLSWDEAVRLDLYYVDNWSLAYDISILWRTIGVVLARKGAY